MTNLYEITYKTSAKSRKVFTAIRCGKNARDASLIAADEFVVAVRCLGEFGGDWCAI